jgi:peptidoglycan hydrolase-like protein with peptidoglycan-binding domain
MPRKTEPRHVAGPARRGWIVAVMIVSLALVGAGAALGAVTLEHHHGSGVGAGTQVRGAESHTPALDLVAAEPADGASAVAPDSALTLTFNAALDPATPLPALQPAVPGTWVRPTPTTISFEPTTSLPPGATLAVSVPGGPGGMRGIAHQQLPTSVVRHYTVAPMSLLRVQQLLAQLGYLPLTFQPSSLAPITPGSMALDQAGTFAWRFATLPAALTSQWSPGAPDAVTRGAIMAFEDQQNLALDGVAGPNVWSALLTAVAANQNNPDPHYDWVDVTTALPQHVTVWRDGSPVYSTPANTGISAAPTAAGTYPVFARYTVTTMKGTNPDGSKYSDPGVPWVSYFNGGDALHGFDRPGYGYPQSLGCVEMPPSNAAVVYPLTPIGTLVTVE